MVKHMSAIATLGNNPVRAKNRQMLRNARMAYVKDRLQRVDVHLVVPQFFNDSNTLRMRYGSEKIGELFSGNSACRHRSIQLNFNTSI